MTTAGQSAFEAMFRQAAIDYRFGTEGPLAKPITYVVAENGIFEVRMNAIGTFARKIAGVPGMGQVAAGFQPALPKIPWALFEQALSFFRAVMERHGGAEAYIQFFFNREEGQYFAHVPEQFVSGGHVSFNRDAELELAHVLVLEAHSHNTMGAFFSGTDNADERGDRIFLVVGHLDCPHPQVLIRYGIAGHHGPLAVDDIFAPPADREAASWKAQTERGAERRREPAADDSMFPMLDYSGAKGVLFDVDSQAVRE